MKPPAMPASPEASSFEGNKFFTNAAHDFVQELWRHLQTKLVAKQTKHLLIMENEVRGLLQNMKDISRSPLSPLEEVLHSFFRSVQSLQDELQQQATKPSDESHSNALSLAAALHADLKSKAEGKSSHIQGVIEELSAIDAREAAFRKELEDLDKGKQEVRTLLQQDKAELESLAIEISTVEKTLVSLKESGAASEEDQARLQQKQRDFEDRKRALGTFALIFT